MTHPTHQPDELPQPAPDALITRALQSLRDTQPPTGLEARVAARLAQAADARIAIRSSVATTSSRTSFFAVILSLAETPRILLGREPIYALAAASFITVSFFVFHHHPNTATITHSPTHPLAPPNQPSSSAESPSLAKALVPQGYSLGSHSAAKEHGALAPLPPMQSYPTNTQVPQGFSLGSHRSIEKAGVLTPASTDPDTLALAETLAPSHPAPPMPLTAQEHLLLLATRQDQPMELAELDTLRQPTLQAAAETHQNATIRRYAQSLLGPLAAAEAMNPTSPSKPDDTPASQPPSSK